MKKQFWKAEEINYLMMIYPDVKTDKIAKSLNRSVSQIYSKANLLGLKKSEVYMKQELERQAIRLRIVGEKARFKKGGVAFNKGKKMPAEVYEKVKGTMFKKGATPHNTKHNGYIRITVDGYKEIRISKGKFRLLHVVNWEKINGKVPKGHCLRAIDGNSLNTQPSNWELISRKDNMIRNSIQRFGPEIRDTIKILSKLKRQIDAKQN